MSLKKGTVLAIAAANLLTVQWAAAADTADSNPAVL
jgi:hypothetical protein